MKYLFTLITILSLNAVTAYCQPAIEIQSDKYDLDKQIYLNNMLTLSDGTIALVRSKYSINNDDPVIERFDKNLKRTYSEPLELKYKEMDLVYNSLIKLNDEIYVISSFENKKDLTTYYFAQHLDKQSFKLDNAYIELIQSHHDEDNKQTTGIFNFVYSSDSTKILFYVDNFNKYNNLTSLKNTKEVLNYSVFDNHLKELNSVQKEIDIIPSKFNMLQYLMVGDNVCLLAKEYINRGGNIVFGKINMFYRIIFFDNKGDIVCEEKIAPEDKLIRDLRLTVDNKNNIICAGYYSNTDLVAIHGSYFMKINGLTLKKETEYTNEFSDEFMYQRMSKKETNQLKNHGEASNYDPQSLNKIFPLSDDNTLMIHEQYSIKSGSNGGAYNIYTFINVICLDPEGKMLWGQKIPKYQQSPPSINDAWTSYLIMQEDDTYYLLFNDNEKNVNANGTKDLERFYKRSQASVQFATISTDGKEYSKGLMISQDELGSLISPKFSYSFSNNNRLVYCFTSGEYKLIKLKIKH